MSKKHDIESPSPEWAETTRLEHDVCRSVREQLPWLLNGSVPMTDSLEQHLDDCVSCQREAARVHQAGEIFGAHLAIDSVLDLASGVREASAAEAGHLGACEACARELQQACVSLHDCGLSGLDRGTEAAEPASGVPARVVSMSSARGDRHAERHAQVTARPPLWAAAAGLALLAAGAGVVLTNDSRHATDVAATSVDAAEEAPVVMTLQADGFESGSTLGWGQGLGRDSFESGGLGSWELKREERQ